MAVEVERKFVCDSTIREKLKDIGAVCLGERRFTDRYFDCADFSLTLGDFWLRSRDGSWELKCPVSSGRNLENRAESLCTRYREVTDLALIQAEVLRVLKCDPGPVGEAPRASGREPTEDEMWLEDLRLVCFAEFTTVRCSYMLEGGGARGVRVDLDQADFGYGVGEIEVLLSEGDDMQSAQQTIQRTAEKLGLGGEKKVQGKMDVYLQRFRPEHYAELIRVHVL